MVTHHTLQNAGAVINKTLQENITLQLDFQHLKTYTPTFLNAGIGQLYRDYDIQFIRDKLSVTDMLSEDIALLIRIVDNAKIFYSNNARLQNTIDVILSN